MNGMLDICKENSKKQPSALMFFFEISVGFSTNPQGHGTSLW